jgi:plasmid stabilization system protein ParE
MRSVIILPEAEREIHAIADRIADDKVSAAERWLQELNRLFALLASFPEIGQQVRLPERVLRRMARGNYVIYYQSFDDKIAILHVFHGAQRHEDMI